MNRALSAPLFRTRLARNPYGKGFVFTLQLRKGAGYRAFDLPGHSMNVAHRFRRHLYIPGVTFTVATNQRPSGWQGRDRKNRRLVVSLRKNGNAWFCPAWWS